MIRDSTPSVTTEIEREDGCLKTVFASKSNRLGY